LSIYWWATFRTTKSAININTLLDLKTSIPEYIFISEGSQHDVNDLDNINLPTGSYLVMDRAYVDFKRLCRLANDRINFVISSKTNMKYEILNSGQTDLSSGVLLDQTIMLTGLNTKQKYPECLRRVRYYDAKTEMILVFLTNNFKISFNRSCLI